MRTIAKLEHMVLRLLVPKLPRRLFGVFYRQHRIAVLQRRIR